MFILQNQQMEKLGHKKILVAGATGGIGTQTAKLLSASGAQLYLTGRNAEKLHSLAESLHLPSNRVFVADLADESAVALMAESIHAEAGALDVLVNAAGLGIIKPVDQLSTKEFMMTLQSNLLSTFFLVRSFLPPMKASGRGLIVNIPGVLGKVPMAGAAAYSASKCGLVGMMQSVREELKRTNVRITNIFLGGVDSNFWEHIDLRVQKDKMIRPEDAARAIWFLCQQPESGVVSEMVLQPFNHQAI
jgi:NADP-dependent 3-hydroxy acid dehydrogenase YdfG